MNDDSTPLIWTTKGNVPIESLQLSVEWDVQPTHIKLTERYTLDGEVVRESAHVTTR